MFKYQFHVKWVLPVLVMLFSTLYLPAQCPLTKPTSFAMVPQGLPSLERLAPKDFFVNGSDTAQYTNLTVSKNHFLCMDLGIQEVTLSGLTKEGNPFNCSEFVWVYDSVFLCDFRGATPVTVAGKLYNEKLEPLSNFSVALSSGSNNYFKGTDENGAFFFGDLVKEQYQLKPGNPFADNVRNGITTFDVLLLQKHILGLRPLDSPYKIIAADMNNSGNVTAYDMIVLRQLILSIIEEFPKTTSWRFVDADYEFANPINPFIDDFPESVSLNMNELGPQLDNRFIAIKMGDMNNSAVTNAARSRAMKTQDTSSLFEIKAQTYQKEDLVEVPFFVNKTINLNGFQMALTFAEEQLELVDIKSGLTLTTGHYNVDNGTINISWISPENTQIAIGESPFSFTFRAKKSGRLTTNLKLKKDQLKPEYYTSNGTIRSFDLIWQKTEQVTEFQAFNNYPNPFSTTTIIPFSLPENREVTLQVFDANGRLIQQKNKHCVAGKNQFEITLPSGNSGIYSYQLKSDFGVAAGRMNYLSK